MFRECINAPIDPIPLEYVNSLYRLRNEPDYSLTCLGIALLKSRIENYAGINGIWEAYNTEEACANNFIDRINALDDVPVFCYYIYNNEAADKDEIKTKLSEYGMEVKESIGLLLKNKASTECTAFYHKEKNICAIFINNRDMRIYHMIISFMSILFPSLFTAKPLKDADYDVIKSLSKTDKDMFVKRIQEAVQPYLFEFRRMMLGTLLKAMHEGKINIAMRRVTDQRDQVMYLEEQYSESIRLLKEYTIQYEGLKSVEKYDEAEEDLVEYLSTNKNIKNMVIRDSRLYFSVATLLNNYNENAWATFAQRGYIFDGNYHREILGVFKDIENRKIILNNLFSEDPDFLIKIAGNYCINLETCRISTDNNYNYEAADPCYKSYLPNPHLKLFSCLGGYRDRIPVALRERNYIGAIEMCIASAGSVDLDETEQTFRPFLGWLLSSREKILRRKDGVEMTPEETLIWLIDKEKENETTETE